MPTTGGESTCARRKLVLSVHPDDLRDYSTESSDTVASAVLGAARGKALNKLLRRARLVPFLTVAALLFMLVGAVLCFVKEAREALGPGGTNALLKLTTAVQGLLGLVWTSTLNASLVRCLSRSLDWVYILVTVLLYGVFMASYFGVRTPAGGIFGMNGYAIGAYLACRDVQHPADFAFSASYTVAALLCAILILCLGYFASHGAVALQAGVDPFVAEWNINGEVVRLYKLEVGLAYLTNEVIWLLTGIFKLVSDPSRLHVIKGRLVVRYITSEEYEHEAETRRQLVTTDEVRFPPLRRRSRTATISPSPQNDNDEASAPGASHGCATPAKRKQRVLFVDPRFSGLFALDTRDNVGRLLFGDQIAALWYRTVKTTRFADVFGAAYVLCGWTAVAHINSKWFRDATSDSVRVLYPVASALAIVSDLNTIFFLNVPLGRLCFNEVQTRVAILLGSMSSIAMIYLFKGDLRSVFWFTIMVHTVLYVGFYDALHPAGRGVVRNTIFAGCNFVTQIMLVTFLFVGPEDLEPPLNIQPIMELRLPTGEIISANAFTFAVTKMAVVNTFLFARIFFVKLLAPGTFTVIGAPCFLRFLSPRQRRDLVAQRAAAWAHSFDDIPNLSAALRDQHFVVERSNTQRGTIRGAERHTRA